MSNSTNDAPPQSPRNVQRGDQFIPPTSQATPPSLNLGGLKSPLTQSGASSSAASGTSTPSDLLSPRGSIVDQFSSPNRDGVLRKTTSSSNITTPQLEFCRKTFQAHIGQKGGDQLDLKTVKKLWGELCYDKNFLAGIGVDAEGLLKFIPEMIASDITKTELTFVQFTMFIKKWKANRLREQEYKSKIEQLSQKIVLTSTEETELDEARKYLSEKREIYRSEKVRAKMREIGDDDDMRILDILANPDLLEQEREKEFENIRMRRAQGDTDSVIRLMRETIEKNEKVIQDLQFKLRDCDCANNNELRALLEQMKEESERLMRELAELNQSRESLQIECNQLQSRQASLNEELSQSQAEKKTLTDEKAALANELQSSQSTVAELKSQLEKSIGALEAEQKKNAKAQEDEAASQSERALEFEAQLARELKMRKRLEGECEDLQRALEDQQAELMTLKNYATLVSSLQLQISKMQERLVECENQVQQYTVTIAELEEKLAAEQKARAEIEANEQRKEKEESESSLELAKKALAERRQQISDTKKDKEGLEELKAQFERARNEWQTQRDGLESKQSALQKIVDEHKEKLLQEETRTSEMAGELSRRSDQQQQTISDQAQRIAQLEKELAERAEELKTQLALATQVANSNGNSTTAASSTTVPEKLVAKSSATPNSSKTATPLKKAAFPFPQIILLGDTSVGKSQFIIQWTQTSSNPLKHNVTIGFDLCQKIIQVGEDDYEVSLWDTAGQERFNALTRNFYLGKHGAMIFFALDDRKSFQAISKWTSNLRQLNPEARVLLVGSKSDLVKQRVVSADEAVQACKDYGFIGYYEVSAKTGTNVDDSVMFLVKDILSCNWETEKTSKVVNLNVKKKEEDGCCS